MKPLKKWARILLCAIGICVFLAGCAGEPALPADTNASAGESSNTGSQTQTTGGSDMDHKEPEQPANMWKYVQDASGVLVREITIDSGKGGDAVEIVQLTDIHINLYNDRDVEENNPALMSTIKNRGWLAGGTSFSNAIRCLEYAKNADRTVITGDIADYLSWGALEAVKEKIFDVYDNLMACFGNHDACRKVQGKVDDPSSLEERMEMYEEAWGEELTNSLHYDSEVIKDKVMLITMDNASRDSKMGEYFFEDQIEPLTKDLQTARENGYVVLIFYHVPIATQNVKYRNVAASKVGDSAASSIDFYLSGPNSVSSHDPTKKIYDLIVSNGDIIKGLFCGHHHSDFYTEVSAKTADCIATVIPQYCLMGVPYGKGNVIRITVK